MTTTVPGMRSNKLVSMDIDQLRGWAAFMDKAMIASLIVTIMAVAALGITTWLSFRFSGAVRAHEHATVDQYKGIESHAVQLEQDVAAARERGAALEKDVSAARERAAALEKDISTARERAAALEKDASTARERTAALEQEASAARERSVAFEQAAREANERAARAESERAARESASASEKARTPQFDAAEIQRRLADLGKLVRDAAANKGSTQESETAEAPGPVQGEGAPEGATANRAEQPSPVVVSLRKYADTKAAVFVLGQVSEAPAAGSTISTYLRDAGWPAETWTWSGVAGIYGVVVLIKQGSDAATHEAASALVEALRSAGFNATKGDWPADWRRFRGVLNGPQTPGPTDAAIRIVIGAKPR